MEWLTMLSHIHKKFPSNYRNFRKMFKKFLEQENKKKPWVAWNNGEVHFGHILHKEAIYSLFFTFVFSYVLFWATTQQHLVHTIVWTYHYFSKIFAHQCLDIDIDSKFILFSAQMENNGNAPKPYAAAAAMGNDVCVRAKWRCICSILSIATMCCKRLLTSICV